MIRRFLAAAVVTAVAGTTALVAPTVASAAPVMNPQATPTATTEWVTAADITTWTGTGAFPAGWFTLDGLSAPTSGVGGLTSTAPGAILHATTGSAATELGSIASTDAENGVLGTADMIQTGDAAYTLTIDLDGAATNTAPATLIASTAGEAGIDGSWTASTAIGAFAPGTEHTLAEFQAQIAATPDEAAATINAYGFSVGATPTSTGTTATVVGIAYQGANSYFTPKPVATATPPSLSQTALRTTGIQIRSTGFVPGEVVRPELILPDAEAVPSSITFTADATGSISGTVTNDSTVPAGDLSLIVGGETSGVFVFFPITVTADPTPAAPVATPVATRASFTG